MSTFVIRFLRETSETFRGHVRHVGSGEEVPFSNYQELYSFMEELRVLNGLIGAKDAPVILENDPARTEKEEET